MKYVKLCFASILGLLVMASVAMAQTYPITSPVYAPNAKGPSTTFTAAGDYTFVTNGLSVVATQISNSCTTLAATFQGSTDNTNYITLLGHPLGAGTAATAVSSVSASGVWRTSVVGLNKMRLHITSASAVGPCTVTMTGTPSYGVME